MRFLLDTDIFIAALKRDPAVLARMEALRPADLILSPIVLGELEVGIGKSQWPRENRQRLDAVISAIPLEPLTGEVGRAYGRIRSTLEREGRVIGANDLWIAAQAQALEIPLVTDNLREFERVEGLALENWLGP